MKRIILRVAALTLIGELGLVAGVLVVGHRFPSVKLALIGGMIFLASSFAGTVTRDRKTHV